MKMLYGKWFFSFPVPLAAYYLSYCRIDIGALNVNALNLDCDVAKSIVNIARSRQMRTRDRERKEEEEQHNK